MLREENARFLCALLLFSFWGDARILLFTLELD